jgi:hypothetical protein
LRCTLNMSSRGCVNSPNCFCYIFGEFMIKKHQRNMTVFIRKVYYDCFCVNLGDLDKSWAPHYVCHVCVEDLSKCSKGMRKVFRFGVPMIRRGSINHGEDCCFCCCDAKGYNFKNKKVILLYQVPMFHVWKGQQSNKSTLGAKTLDTKDISWTWEQEHFAQKPCRFEVNTAATPSC